MRALVAAGDIFAATRVQDDVGEGEFDRRCDRPRPRRSPARQALRLRHNPPRRSGVRHRRLHSKLQVKIAEKMRATGGRSGAWQTDYQSLMIHSSNIPGATQLTGTSTEMKMTEATVTKVVGAVYCAFATMLSEEGLGLMRLLFPVRSIASFRRNSSLKRENSGSKMILVGA